MSEAPLIEVKNLKTYFHTPGGLLRAVDDVSFHVKRGETLGIVGESGCGKSVTCLSILRLVQTPPGKYEGGEIVFDGHDILKMNQGQLQELRGGRIAMIFQEPMVALNPAYTIGNQIREALRLHNIVPKSEAHAKALELMYQVRIPNADKVLNSYPFMLSGGMRQRAMIAMALSCQPDVLICDEPTTALDVTIQAQILNLVNQLKNETGSAIIFITHDLGVISEIADRVMVMYAGKICESATTEEIIFSPHHPYTQGLIASKPSGLTTEGNRLKVIPGNVPSLLNKPSGCPFHPRCPVLKDICKEKFPETVEVKPGHTVACWNMTGGKS
ncbi:MAG: ABC transporter ATP-binding protein [Treponema sp.]|nr:ABC transporter ATP-binding protein [Treponema sp.]